MASDMIGYSLSNDWNAVSGMPAIGKFLPSDRNAIRLAAPDVNTVSRTVNNTNASVNSYPAPRGDVRPERRHQERQQRENAVF